MSGIRATVVFQNGTLYVWVQAATGLAETTVLQGCIDRTLIGYSLTHTLGYQVVNPEKAAQGIVCFFICCLRVLF